jgi:hypothetical protein
MLKISGEDGRMIKTLQLAFENDAKSNSEERVQKAENDAVFFSCYVPAIFLSLSLICLLQRIGFSKK